MTILSDGFTLLPISLTALQLYFLFPCFFFTLTTFLSFSSLHHLTPSICQTSVYFTYVFSLCSHYGLNLLRPTHYPHPTLLPPPSLAMFLCSSSWRRRLCSSFLLAFLVSFFSQGSGYCSGTLRL
ncbi:hypothetical protein ATANTOWER_008467 [Ataeniobius toweri]|uniref:Uncharacterized protein n=1 Tax=Ataeniobius toweri TaxID=208326 RepID=A0ABU7AZ58_9TELE|nr:hypothetical protein [Ataeniobius toweri]